MGLEPVHACAIILDREEIEAIRGALFEVRGYFFAGAAAAGAFAGVSSGGL